MSGYPDEAEMRTTWQQSIRPDDAAIPELCRAPEPYHKQFASLYPQHNKAIQLTQTYAAMEIICDGFGVETEQLFTSDGGPISQLARGCVMWSLSGAGWSHSAIAGFMTTHPTNVPMGIASFQNKATERAKDLGKACISSIRVARVGFYGPKPGYLEAYMVAMNSVVKHTLELPVSVKTASQKLRRKKIAEMALCAVLINRSWRTREVAAFRGKSIGVIFRYMRELARGEEPMAELVFERVVFDIDELRAKHGIKQKRGVM